MPAMSKTQPDIGLLIIRVGLGIAFIFHGWPKLAGGAAAWSKLGGAMANLGLDFAPTFFGFAAAVAEFGGGICLMLGLFFRPVTALMAATMGVAVVAHLNWGDAFVKYSHALEAAIVFVGLFITGPGRYRLLKTL